MAAWRSKAREASDRAPSTCRAHHWISRIRRRSPAAPSFSAKLAFWPTPLRAINLEQSGTGALTLAPSITVTAAGIAESIYGTMLNQGLISVLAGADLTINDSLLNAGTVSIAPGGVISLYGSLANAGTLIGTGGTIVAFGSVTVPELQTLAASGAMVVLGSTLDNTGGTLSVGPGEAVPLLTLGGFISFGAAFGEILGGVVPGPGRQPDHRRRRAFRRNLSGHAGRERSWCDHPERHHASRRRRNRPRPARCREQRGVREISHRRCRRQHRARGSGTSPRRPACGSGGLAARTAF